MRARLALFSACIPCELREVVLRDKPAALLAASIKGTVPVLLLPDGTVLEQSLDIMRWALARNDPAHWLPTDAVVHQQVLAQIAACDGDFKAQLDRYKYPNRFGLTSTDSPRDQGARFLCELEQQLHTTDYLAGAAWGLADAAIAPFVRQWAHTDPAWFAQQPWPALQRWLQDFEASAAFAVVMTKWAPWVAGSPAVAWPALA
jgi:glutathione S-transferase